MASFLGGKRLEGKGRCVLVGVSGSVAAVKVPELVVTLLEHDSVAEVIVVVTASAARFLMGSECPAQVYQPEHFAQLQLLVAQGAAALYVDEDEWKGYKKVGSDPVIHIELCKWADVFVVAPLSANTLAKLSNGLCDNLLTCVARAWTRDKRTVVAPAMNSHMWQHPLTRPQLTTLQSFGNVQIVMPVVKTLACGDTGTGALAAVADIVSATFAALHDPSQAPEPVAWP